MVLMERKRNYKKREREREEKLYGLEEKDNIVMFTDQICQKKKKVKKEKKEEAHWLRPNISEYTINNKHYVKFTRGFFFLFPYIYISLKSQYCNLLFQGNEQ